MMLKRLWQCWAARCEVVSGNRWMDSTPMPVERLEPRLLLSGAQISEVARLDLAEAGVPVNYAHSVSVDGPYAIVGAPGQASADGAFGEEGSAYIYTWDGAEWGRSFVIDAPDPLETELP